jgi:hypothetical protein
MHIPAGSADVALWRSTFRECLTISYVIARIIAYFCSSINSRFGRRFNISVVVWLLEYVSNVDIVYLGCMEMTAVRHRNHPCSIVEMTAVRHRNHPCSIVERTAVRHKNHLCSIVMLGRGGGEVTMTITTIIFQETWA